MKVLSSYVTSDGVKITVYAPARPRKSEKVWRGNSKYSISSVGAKAAKLGSRCVQATTDEIFS